MCEAVIDNNEEHRQGSQSLKITFPFHCTCYFSCKNRKKKGENKFIRRFFVILHL